jgi:hypothetical protein
MKHLDGLVNTSPLFHRWNEPTALSSTTLADFEDRKRGIEISDLSLTFQDAIEVTLELQIQYLWIDSLCIIQDSEEDWTREAFDMIAVYESARMDQFFDDKLGIIEGDIAMFLWGNICRT